MGHVNKSKAWRQRGVSTCFGQATIGGLSAQVPFRPVLQTPPVAFSFVHAARTAGTVGHLLRNMHSSHPMLPLPSCCVAGGVTADRPCSAGLSNTTNTLYTRFWPAGTLMVFAVVSVALIWKRVHNRDLTFAQQQKPFWLITLMALASIGEMHTVLEG